MKIPKGGGVSPFAFETKLDRVKNLSRLQVTEFLKQNYNHKGPIGPKYNNDMT